MWPEPSSPLLQASPSRVLPQRNRELPYSPDGGLNSFPPRRLTAKGLSHRKRIALFAVLAVSNLYSWFTRANIKYNCTGNLSKTQNLEITEKLAKKAIKKPKTKPKASTKKPVKEKAKPTPKSKKEIKKEEPKTKTEKIQLTQSV